MKLRVATDCSGIEAPIEALIQMKIPFDHIWSCDSDKYVQQTIAANYSPMYFYPDITERDNSKLPDIDMYVCGFPCQPFSALGKQLGTNDPRGNIMLHCIETIKIKLPKIFVLENVRRFKSTQKGKPYEYLMKSLREIENSYYNVYSMILNTKDYGIPQSRTRLFIIGIRKNVQKRELQVPRPKKMKPLESFIIDKTIYKRIINNKALQKNIDKINNENGCICTSDTFNTHIKYISPTLTSICQYLYHTTYNRYLTHRECLLLQGFKKKLKQVVPDRQFFKQIGNSMSVNVLKEIFNEIFKTVK